MSILVFIEHEGNKIKKSSLETALYGAAIAQQEGSTAQAVVLGDIDAAQAATLGKYGISKVWQVGGNFSDLDASRHSRAVSEVAQQCGATTIVFSHNYTGKAVAPRVAARLKAGLVSGIATLPKADGIVCKSSFSGKAFADYRVLSPIRILSLTPNSMPVKPTSDNSAAVETVQVNVPVAQVKVKQVVKLSDKIPLTEAEIVVSGGRGLKGPENWGMIEEMANILGAATACSRPVADTHWRPHHEHVGQTGIAISPNLYIAIGISGAIQHLAGVSSSKVIVVINKDAEAPFFKAADYGVIGDAFEVVPRLNEALKKFKASQQA